MTLNLGRIILDLGWLLFLIILWIHFWRGRNVLINAQSWLKTKGRIVHCEWSQVGQSLWPKIEYSYQVHEQDLRGTYLLLDTSHHTPNSKHARRVAYQAALAFKENSEIDIYYNPNHPEQSALDVVIPLKLNIILILITMVIVVHVGFIFYRFLL